jgi:hypothetical protein
MATQPLGTPEQPGTSGTTAATTTTPLHTGTNKHRQHRCGHHGQQQLGAHTELAPPRQYHVAMVCVADECGGGGGTEVQATHDKNSGPIQQNYATKKLILKFLCNYLNFYCLNADTDTPLGRATQQQTGHKTAAKEERMVANNISVKD